MAQKTLIGFQNSTDNKIIVVPTNDRSGQLNITGKVLNSLYNNAVLAKQLVETGTNPNGNGNIDVSDTVGIDNYMWGSGGLGLGIDKIYNDPSQYLNELSNPWHTHIYMFSETDNEWLVASRDNQTFRSLASEL